MVLKLTLRDTLMPKLFSVNENAGNMISLIAHFFK